LIFLPIDFFCRIGKNLRSIHGCCEQPRFDFVKMIVQLIYIIVYSIIAILALFGLRTAIVHFSNRKCVFCAIRDGKLPSKKEFDNNEFFVIHDIGKRGKTYRRKEEKAKYF
jgi:hypothetical protein